MTDDIQKAFNELKNAIWMLVIPLVLGLFTLVGGIQWMIQDLEWTERLEELEPLVSGDIYEVEPSECSQPKPEGTGHICAQSTDWWSPNDYAECEGGQCYIPAHLNKLINLLDDMERSYTTILIPGLLPLIFLFVIIRKITKARRFLNTVIDSQPPSDSV